MSVIFNFEEAAAASRYDEQRQPMGANVIAGLLYCTFIVDLHVLDAGCGTGQYTKALLDFGVGKFTILDTSAAMLEVARQKLSEFISNGAIEEIVEAKLPALPFENGTFDAVMFNMVLHHLHNDKNDRGFQMIEKAFQEAKRVLRNKGVLMFTMPLPATLGSPWYTHLQPEFIRKVAHHFPSTEQYMDLFATIGFTCVAGVNLLSKAMPPLLKNHFDHDGPFKEEWRIATCVFNNAKGEILENILADLKQKAPLKEFMETHDRTSDIGQITLFVCISN